MGDCADHLSGWCIIWALAAGCGSAVHHNQTVWARAMQTCGKENSKALHFPIIGHRIETFMAHDKMIYKSYIHQLGNKLYFVR